MASERLAFDPTRVSALKHVDKSGDGTCCSDSGEGNSSESGDADENKMGSSDDDGSQKDNGEISNENETLYLRRYDEGFDLFDPGYIFWLEQHHPEAVPADRYTLVSSADASVSKSQEPNSVLDNFLNVAPCESLPPQIPDDNGAISPQSSDDNGGASFGASTSSCSTTIHPNHSSAGSTIAKDSANVSVPTHNSNNPPSSSMETPTHTSHNNSSSSSSCSSSSSGLAHQMSITSHSSTVP